MVLVCCSVDPRSKLVERRVQSEYSLILNSKSPEQNVVADLDYKYEKQKQVLITGRRSWPWCCQLSQYMMGGRGPF